MLSQLNKYVRELESAAAERGEDLSNNEAYQNAKLAIAYLHSNGAKK